MSLRGFELFYDGAFQAVEAYEQEGWKFKTGPSDLTGQEPGSLEVTLVNDDLSIDPSNPLSPLYGKIGPNSWARMLMYDPAPVSISATFGSNVSSAWPNADTGEVWTMAGGSASDYSSSGGVGRMSLGTINASRRGTIPGSVGNGEISVRVTIPVDPTGDDIETTIMFLYQDASNYLQASIFWDRDSRPIELRFVKRVAGVASDLAIGHLETTPVGAGLSCDMRLRWFGVHMALKVWPSADPEPDTWNLSARDATWTTGLRGLRANLQPAFAGGTPQVVTWDNFTYAAYNASVVAAGEASSYRPETTPEHVPGLRGRSWTGFSADDVLRRIGKMEDSSISPLKRQISSYTSLLGYWPLEEGPDAKNFSNVASPGRPGYFDDLVDLGAGDGPAGGFNSPVVNLDGAIGGSFKFDTSTNGYQLSFCMKLDAVPSAAPYIAMFQWSDTMRRTWYWRINNAAFEVAVYDSDFSTLLDSQTASWSGILDPTKWVRYRIKVSVSGSTVTFEPAFYQQDSITSAGFTGSFTNVSVGYPVAWRVVANSYTDKASYAHVFGISDLTLDLVNSSSARDPFNAYNGEPSWLRFARLMIENGFNYLVRGTITACALMGRQPRASLAELLQQIQVTEGGIIYGDATRIRLIFRLNDDLINQTPILALTKGGNLGYPFKKIIDDQRLANDITVKNWDTTEVRVTKETGPRSIQAQPAGIGRVPGSLEVSLAYADAIEQRGYWELANNTINRPRYPSVTVDLLAFPALVSAVNTAAPGDIITVAGAEVETIYLIIINFERSGTDVRDTVTFTCQPADTYMAGTYDDGVSKFDSSSTTLSADISSSTTSVPIFSADPMDKWATAGGYTIRVGPELMSVSSCTTGSASGNGWAQTMTVTRGTNGVQIKHYSGTEVHVGTPGKYVMLNREG